MAATRAGRDPLGVPVRCLRMQPLDRQRRGQRPLSPARRLASSLQGRPVCPRQLPPTAQGSRRHSAGLSRTSAASLPFGARRRMSADSRDRDLRLSRTAVPRRIAGLARGLYLQASGTGYRDQEPAFANDRSGSADCQRGCLARAASLLGFPMVRRPVHQFVRPLEVFSPNRILIQATS